MGSLYRVKEAARPPVLITPPQTQTAKPPPLPPAGTVVGLLALNWFIPGGAFMLKGRWGRGLFQFAIVAVTFSLGLVFHGGVIWPSWAVRTQSFNLINNIMFCAEMLSGLPALLSLAADLLQKARWLGGNPMHPYFELGGLYIVFAGAINYFGVCNFYDRCLRQLPRYASQEVDEGGES